jgi:Domain of unknown function (DUF4055)
MSVTTTHPQYVQWADTWDALRTAYDGSKSVKGGRDLTRANRGPYVAGTKWLPRPAGMKTEAQYSSYRDRAAWTGATESAVHGITGSVFRHEPQIEAPASLEPHLADITQTGISLRMFAEQAVRETLLMGRFGLLVDFPPPVVELPGIEAMPDPQARPYWVAYPAEEIINWRTIQRGGDTILSLVVLREVVSEPQGPWGTPEFFVVEEQTAYRVLRLDEQGHYEVSLWLEDRGAFGRGPSASMMARWVPLRQGVPLDFLPFVFLAPFSLEPGVQKSLLEALVERNFLCWRHSADYEHALHLTAMPTFYVAANMEQPPELYVGASMALFLPDNQAKVGLVEFHGQGLQPHEHALQKDLEMMAALGARLLEGPPTVQETATGVQRRLGGTDSPMQSLVSCVSQGLTWALQTHAWWNGSTDNVDDDAVHVALNKDLVSNTMEPQMLTALMTALLNGTISYETFYFNLQRGEVARPLVPVEDEIELVELRREQQPLAPPPAPASPPAGRNGSTRTAA